MMYVGVNMSWVNAPHFKRYDRSNLTVIARICSDIAFHWVYSESMQGELRNIEGEVVADLNAELQQTVQSLHRLDSSGRVELSLSGAASTTASISAAEARILTHYRRS